MAAPDYYLPAQNWRPVAGLPAAWGGWDPAWPYCHVLRLQNDSDLERAEPVIVEVEVYAHQSAAPERGLRVAAPVSDDGPVREVPCQVHAEAPGAECGAARSASSPIWDRGRRGPS